MPNWEKQVQSELVRSLCSGRTRAHRLHSVSDNLANRAQPDDAQDAVPRRLGGSHATPIADFSSLRSPSLGSDDAVAGARLSQELKNEQGCVLGCRCGHSAWGVAVGHLVLVEVFDVDVVVTCASGRDHLEVWAEDRTEEIGIARMVIDQEMVVVS